MFTNQTANNIYLCLDLCTGGTLSDPIRNKSHYYEKSAIIYFVRSPSHSDVIFSDVLDMIRTILSGVKYLHSVGIAHRGTYTLHIEIGHAWFNSLPQI